MNPTFESAAHAYFGPKIVRNFKMKWLVYGAVAYYGLRFLRKRGIFAKQADAALNIIDKGINSAKGRIIPRQQDTQVNY